MCFWEVLPTGNEKLRGHANDNVVRAIASEIFFPFCTSDDANDNYVILLLIIIIIIII